MYHTVLKKDAAQATREARCIKALQGKADELIIRGKFYEAEQYMLDALKSVNELKRMQDRKKQQDRVNEFAALMHREGVTIELVRRVMND